MARTTVGDAHALIPRDCFAIDPVRSWRSLAQALLRLLGCELLLSLIVPTAGWHLLWQLPALAAALLLCGWAFTGLFVIGHDCAHMAFAQRRWVNELVGHLCLSPTFTGFHNWRIWHNFHHAKTQLRGIDPDWPEKMMPRAEYDAAPLSVRAHVRLGFGTPLGILTGFWVGMFRRTFMKRLAPQIPLSAGAPRQLLLSTLLMVGTCAAISCALVHFGGVGALLKYYLGPSLIAAAHGALLTYLHHTSGDALVFDRADWTPLRGQVISTFNVRFPRWIESMWFDINIHLPHHLAPKIPWYHLRRAAAAIREQRPELYQERRFSLGYLRAAWARPLIVRVPEQECYKMAPMAKD